MFEVNMFADNILEVRILPADCETEETRPQVIVDRRQGACPLLGQCAGFTGAWRHGANEVRAP